MTSERGSRRQRALAYAVHLYTASGVVLALYAAIELCTPSPDPRRVLLLLAGTVLIDATDGPLARRWETKRWAARIDGRTIDDIVDYLTYTFLPLLLVLRMEWLPAPAALWIVPALIASLFGFANVAAKDEEGGFFLGFPSYWNVVALYAGIWNHLYGPWVNAVALLVLAGLTVTPIALLYPNLVRAPWKVPILGGAVVWLATLLYMLTDYPAVPAWLMWASLAYPAFYTMLSFHLKRRAEPTALA